MDGKEGMDLKKGTFFRIVPSWLRGGRRVQDAPQKSVHTVHTIPKTYNTLRNNGFSKTSVRTWP